MKMFKALFVAMAVIFAADANALGLSEKNYGMNDGHYVKMETAYGDVVMKLMPEVAPLTVAKFMDRVREGFYDGLDFHRVIPGFVAQGGDPRRMGRKPVDYTIPPEFSNVVKHKRGSVAMARTNDPNSATTQFYITYGRQPHLDAQYTIFGEVVSGMDAVDQIQQGDKMIKVYMIK